MLAQTVSAADGHFTLSVPPGRYVVTGTLRSGVPMPQTLHRSVTVTSRGFVDIRMPFDSGIRSPTPEEHNRRGVSLLRRWEVASPEPLTRAAGPPRPIGSRSYHDI